MTEKRRTPIPTEIKKALELRDAGKTAEAKAAFEHALRLHPSHAKAWWVLGGIWWDEHEYDTASRCFERAATLRPRDEDCSAALFHALIDGGRCTEAVAEARRFLSEVEKGAPCSNETRNAYADWISDPEGMAEAWSRAKQS